MAEQVAGEDDPQCGDRMWIMPLGSDASPGAGSRAGVRVSTPNCFLYNTVVLESSAAPLAGTKATASGDGGIYTV